MLKLLLLRANIVLKHYEKVLNVHLTSHKPDVVLKD